MKKKPLTLLEVMTALALTSILVTILFGYYRHMGKVSGELRAAKLQLLPRQYIDLRLSPLFNELALSYMPYDKESPLVDFYTLSHSGAKGKALAFQYDAGINKDPRFCSVLQGVLYVNNKNQMCLTSFPRNEQLAEPFPLDKGQTDILAEDVKCLTFSFFDAKTKEWVAEWTPKARALPVMIKLSIGSGQQEYALVYFLPGAPIKL